MPSVRATTTWTPRGDLGRFIESVVTPAAREAADESAKIVLGHALERVPVDTGELRDSGHVNESRETGKTVVAEIVFDAEHAAYLEYGTGIRGASSPDAGKGPYSPTWPGMRPQPYLRPAMDDSHDEIREAFAASISAVIR